MPPLLAQQLVAHPDVPTTHLMVFCHGVFGMGTNFRSIAKALVEVVPGLGVLLVDLRGHGATPPMPPPHDLDAAAADVLRVMDAQTIPVVSLAGHSFGGKVVLDALALRPGVVRSAFVLDSMPGPRPMDPASENAVHVLGVLESLPPRLESRDAFKTELASKGFSAPIIEWLAMNVRREGDHYALRLDLVAIRAMLVDYFARDLWPVVLAQTSTERLTIVVAGKSTVFDASSRERLEAIANPNLSVVTLAGAGHWLHVDDPRGLVEAMQGRI